MTAKILTTLDIDESVRVWLCPTDTIYGLSARHDDGVAIERIRALKQRPDNMPFITLIADFAQLAQLGVTLTSRHRALLERVWPGPVSVIIGESAYRMPQYPELRELIREIGPIVSTSANKHDQAPAQTAQEAVEIFGDSVDAYIDIGPLDAETSVVIRVVR